MAWYFDYFIFEWVFVDAGVEDDLATTDALDDLYGLLYTDTIVPLRSRVDDLFTGGATRQGQIDVNTGEVGALNIAVEALVSHQTQVAGEIADLDIETERNKSNALILANQFVSHQTQVAGEIAVLDGETEMNKSNALILANQLVSYQAEVSDDVASLVSRFDNFTDLDLENPGSIVQAIGFLESKTNLHNTLISVIDGLLTSIQNSMSTLESNVAVLDAKVSTLESTLSNVELTNGFQAQKVTDLVNWRSTIVNNRYSRIEIDDLLLEKSDKSGTNHRRYLIGFMRIRIVKNSSHIEHQEPFNLQCTHLNSRKLLFIFQDYTPPVGDYSVTFSSDNLGLGLNQYVNENHLKATKYDTSPGQFDIEIRGNIAQFVEGIAPTVSVYGN